MDNTVVASEYADEILHEIVGSPDLIEEVRRIIREQDDYPGLDDSPLCEYYMDGSTYCLFVNLVTLMVAEYDAEERE